MGRAGGLAEKVWDQVHAAAWAPRGDRLAVLETETRRKTHLLRPSDSAWQGESLELSE